MQDSLTPITETVICKHCGNLQEIYIGVQDRHIPGLKLPTPSNFLCIHCNKTNTGAPTRIESIKSRRAKLQRIK